MIPKRIHYCWLSGSPLPENIQRYIDGWKQLLPDYEFRLWDAAAFEVNSVLWVKEAVEERKYAFAADYIRFYALYHFGGIYLDSDVKVLKRFDEFLKYPSFIGFEYCGVPEAAVIGCEPGCLWIKDCLDWYDKRSFRKPDGSLKCAPVPLLIKDILEKRTGTVIIDSGTVIKLSEVVLYPCTYFSPKSLYTNKMELSLETVCVHHFSSGWLKKGFLFKFSMFLHLVMLALIGKENHNRFWYHLWRWPYRKDEKDK